MEFNDIEQLVNYRLKQLELIDIDKQLPPADKDVLMLLENGVMVVGYITEANELIIREDIYNRISSEDIKHYDVIGWLDYLLGDMISDALV